jgi:hypothetical protein
MRALAAMLTAALRKLLDPALKGSTPSSSIGGIFMMSPAVVW